MNTNKIQSSMEEYFLKVNEYKSFFKTVTGGEGDKCYYPTRLDTYGKGCYYNCKYCYSKLSLDFRKLWYPNDVGVAQLRDINKVINTKLNEGDVVRLGGLTDCFQPVERVYQNTLKTIKLLNRRGVHYLIVTKSDLITSDEYLDALDYDLAHIQVSIPSDDNNVLNSTDNAPSFEVRKETVETLYDEGFDVSLRLSPFLFDTVDFDVINSINVDKCLVEFLRVKPSLFSVMGDFCNVDEFTVKEGGYRHYSLDKKLSVLELLDFKELTVCDDVQEHYDYFQDYVNFNKNDCCNLNIKKF